MADKRRERVQVYVGWGRPAYDTAPLAEGELTDGETRTLRGLITRYVGKCRERAKPGPKGVFRRTVQATEGKADTDG